MQAAFSRRPEDERARAFAAAIDAIRAEIEAQLGESDVRYIKRVRLVSTAGEVVGRTLINVSIDPLTFFAGVAALFVHKQLEAAEIGHSALHGAFDKLPGAEPFRSQGFRWKAPIDERSWHEGHNLRHHQYTNVAGSDPDASFGPVRISEHMPEESIDPLLSTLAISVAFGFLINMHFTGLEDIYIRRGRTPFVTLRDRSWASIVDAHKRALRKWIPYYAYNFVLFPVLAGPFAWKVLLGNVLAELMRDVYSTATIYCGHIGEHVRMHPAGTRAKSRAQWYVMQVESSQDFEVPLPLSILCGALDKQIEHHLFPRLPPNRLREVVPRVRAACEAHGVRYNSGSWPKVLGGVFRRIRALRSN